MKLTYLFLCCLICTAAQAQTRFSAKITSDQKLFVILVDDLIPPFEAGELWSSLIGNGPRKMVVEPEFYMDCQAYRDLSGEMIGNCKIKVPAKFLEKNGSQLVFKRQGPMAAKFNRYFIDSAYVSMQRGDAWLSSYNPRREFFFGLEENLIHR